MMLRVSIPTADLARLLLSTLYQAVLFGSLLLMSDVR